MSSPPSQPAAADASRQFRQKKKHAQSASFTHKKVAPKKKKVKSNKTERSTDDGFDVLTGLFIRIFDRALIFYAVLAGTEMTEDVAFWALNKAMADEGVPVKLSPSSPSKLHAALQATSDEAATLHASASYLREGIAAIDSGSESAAVVSAHIPERRRAELIEQVCQSHGPHN